MRRPIPEADSRRRRTLVLIAAAAAAAALLYLLDNSGTGPHTAKTATLSPTHAAATTDGPASTAKPPPATTTSTTTPIRRNLPIATATVAVSAQTASGTEVSVPTTVWYPPGRGTFPLVVFSPGYQISPSVYEPLIAAWASAGYVVAEPEYPDTAPGEPADEYDMVNHPGELRTVITFLLKASTAGSAPLLGLIDPSEVAVAGHSDGGDVSLAAAANSCCRDPRVKAAVILSGAEQGIFGGTYYSTPGPPLLVTQGTADTVNAPACSQMLFDAASAPRYYLNLPQATHLSPYTAGGLGEAAVQSATITFLDGYLKASPSSRAALLGLGTVTGTLPLSGSCLGAPAAG
jgi:predicted dienelactone hydrolase